MVDSDVPVARVPTSLQINETLRNTLRAAVASIPGVGGPLSVLIEAAFPDPRLAKIEDWLAHVAGEVGRLAIAEVDLRARLDASEISRTILIEAFAAAQRTTSSAQRVRLAKLMVDGLSEGEAAQLDVLKLLRMFASLDEREVLLLLALGLKPEPRSRFEQSNRAVFEWPVLSHSSTPDDLDIRAMHDMRVRNLLALGLVKRKGPVSLRDHDFLTWGQVQIARPGIALVRMMHATSEEVVEAPDDR